MFILTQFATEQPGRLRAMTARTRQFYYVDTRQRFWTATVSARRYGLSASTIHNRLRKKTVSSVLKRSDNDETSQACLSAMDAISSGSVSTGTGFRSVAKPDLHSAMLVVKRTNKRCWDCYVLEGDRFGGGSFGVWGGKIV